MMLGPGANTGLAEQQLQQRHYSSGHLSNAGTGTGTSEGEQEEMQGATGGGVGAGEVTGVTAALMDHAAALLAGGTGVVIGAGVDGLGGLEVQGDTWGVRAEGQGGYMVGAGDAGGLQIQMVGGGQQVPIVVSAPSAVMPAFAGYMPVQNGSMPMDMTTGGMEGGVMAVADGVTRGVTPPAPAVAGMGGLGVVYNPGAVAGNGAMTAMQIDGVAGAAPPAAGGGGVGVGLQRPRLQPLGQGQTLRVTPSGVRTTSGEQQQQQQ